MQGFTDDPRSGFTRQNILDLIGWSPEISYDCGMELLDNSNNPVYNLTDYLVNDEVAKVSHDCQAEIPGSATFTTEYNFNWGVDRVKLYYLMSCPRLVPNGPARFDLGVYIVTTPNQPLGDLNPQYPVAGYDVVYLLTSVIGDTYQVPAGTNYYTAINAAIQRALGVGVPFTLLLDQSKMTAVVPTDMVWPLDSTDNQTRWLDVINDLLAAIAFQPIWADQVGAYRSGPNLDPAARPIEFILGAGYTPAVGYLDPNWNLHTIVRNEDRVITRDSWNAPNRWTFIQNNLDFEPVVGSGKYVVNNTATGPTSQAALGGRVIQAAVQFLDASGQADLQAQGDKIVADAINGTESLNFYTAPLPLAAHFDILQLMDPTLPGTTAQRKLVNNKWELPLFGADMSWECTAAPPDTANWNTSGGVSGGIAAQNIGGGGLKSIPEQGERPSGGAGTVYVNPTPKPPALPVGTLPQ